MTAGADMVAFARRGDALAVPATPRGDQVLNQVIFVVALASVLGSGWVMASYACLKELRSYRHQLILGLAISDFLMALNFMFSAGIDIAGGDLGLEKNDLTCSVNGFLTQLFVVQTDYWILIIAIATYIILGNFKAASQFIQTYAFLPWIPPWAISIIIAIVCQIVLGYGYIGAWCWLTDDLMRLVVNFIPRWIIVITIAGIYLRLYLIVRKARKWDVEGVGSKGPSDENADTSVILVSIGKGQGINSGIKKTTSISVQRTSASPETGSLEDVHVSASPHQSYPRSGRNTNMSHSRTGRSGHGQNQPMNADQLKRIAKKMMVYPLAYAIIWAVPTSIRIYQSATGERAPLWITVVDKSCIVIQGFIDAIVYGLNERAWQGWRDHIQRVWYKKEGGQRIY